MEQFKLFIELTRLKKPIGYMLLFWPCSWGLTLAYDFTGAINVFLIYLILFFTGSVLMRSAGCIVNDIVDRNFDKKVSRTKNRPIASGEVNLFQGLLYSVVLCAIAFVVLIQFNLLTIILAIGSMPLAFTYPLMKRYTYWPQLYLGITFNYGVILGWTSITNELNLLPVIFFIGAIFWTLAYDTIYGFQDIKDDEIIGLKSTSIKFKHNPYLFLKICYLFLILVSLHMFYFQISKLNIRKEESCLKIFKTNNLLGLMVFFSILVGKIL
jgi:4-hydroxybenzoate polyprenyltransferase